MISTERNELATLPIDRVHRFANPVKDLSEMARCRGETEEWTCDRRDRCERNRLVACAWLRGIKLDRLCYSGYSFHVDSDREVVSCADEF